MNSSANTGIEAMYCTQNFQGLCGNSQGVTFQGFFIRTRNPCTVPRPRVPMAGNDTLIVLYFTPEYWQPAVDKPVLVDNRLAQVVLNTRKLRRHQLPSRWWQVTSSHQNYCNNIALSCWCCALLCSPWLCSSDIATELIINKIMLNFFIFYFRI